MLLQQVEQLFPQVGVEGGVLGVAHPAVGAPLFGPALLDGVDDVFGIGIEGHRARLLEGGKAGDDGSQLHAVVGGPLLPAGKLLADPLVAQNDPVAARPGIARAGAVGEDLYLFFSSHVKTPFFNNQICPKSAGGSKRARHAPIIADCARPDKGKSFLPGRNRDRAALPYFCCSGKKENLGVFPSKRPRKLDILAIERYNEKE